MRIIEPHSRTVISLDEARARLREYRGCLTSGVKAERITAANPVNFEGCEEPTERLLQFHPVFRYLAE